MTAISYRFAGFFAAIVAAPLLFCRAAAAASFDKCASGIKAQVIKAGIKPDIANAAFKGIKFDEKAVRFSRSQPEYRLAIWDYMAFLVDEARIADGAAMMKKHQQTLRAVEKALWHRPLCARGLVGRGKRLWPGEGRFLPAACARQCHAAPARSPPSSRPN